MRWPETKDGEERKIRRFLFKPKKLNDEWRWWEWAEIRQMMVAPPWSPETMLLPRCRQWVDLCWGDDTDYIPMPMSKGREKFGDTK